MRTSTWSVIQMISPILFCCTILVLSSHCGSAIQNITSKNSLVDGQTLVSAGNRFELGFFGPSNSSNVKRYVGIWYTSNPEIVVWVANRTNPIPDKTGRLSIAKDGNLKLLDKGGKVYWSSKINLERFNLANPVVKLIDTGNLVLRYGQFEQNLIWQSFENPTDTFLFGMRMDKSLGSWSSEEDPAPGNFTFKQDPEVRDQYVVMEKSTTFWKSYRPDSVQVFRPQENEMLAIVVNFLNSMNNGTKNLKGQGLAINITGKRQGTENFKDQRLVMNFNGELQYWQLDADTKSWSLIWKVPKDNCSLFNYCGNFGICNANNRLPCKCMPGFKPKFPDKWNAGYFSDGCTRNSTSSCGNTFLNFTNLKVENTEPPYEEAKDETECKQECLAKCQCQAYSYIVQREKSACFIWTEDLKDLHEDNITWTDGYQLCIRVAVSDIESTTRNCKICGTNLVPYPLSTGPKCGDATYSSFHCNKYTNQLSFITSSGNYPVTNVNPEARKFVIQIKSKEANNCDSLQSSGSKILQLNQSSPFSVTSWCGSGLVKFTSNESSLNDTVEVEISWTPPPEPTCNSSADCKDWPDSTCNKTGNGQSRCLCNTKFRWDGSALNCSQAALSGNGQAREAPNRNKSIPLIIGLPIAMALLCMVVSIYLWRRKVIKKRTKQRKAALQRYDTERGVKELIDTNEFKEKDGTGIDVPFFDFESIIAATDNFSKENQLGKGGFGPVYKGNFPGREEIAVKRLSSVSGQGLEEFKNEVVLIAKLQHRNLVRLLGYCISGEEKILLYEYMPNKSLDSWIFDESLSHQLNWETRFNIIMGIARGMLYLHQDSRLRIIHRDLKTSNILLDAEMNPKISDFGLARMIQGKQTEANTIRVVGTYGYMAPEYALDGLFSAKSDVFSFGVLMLEIISGKKNMRFYSVEHAPSLISYAWELWQEGKAMDLMDESLRSSCNESQFSRCLHVGLLCMQEDPDERPTMSTVVVLLGSETATASLPLPKQPAFVSRKTVSSSASTSSKHAEISTTLQEGR